MEIYVFGVIIAFIEMCCQFIHGGVLWGFMGWEIRKIAVQNDAHPAGKVNTFVKVKLSY